MVNFERAIRPSDSDFYTLFHFGIGEKREMPILGYGRHAFGNTASFIYHVAFTAVRTWEMDC